MQLAKRDVVLFFSVIIHLLLLPGIILHESANPSVLARYSFGYAFFIAVSLFSLLAYSFTSYFRASFYKHLSRISGRLIFAALILLWLLLVALQFAPVEDSIKEFFILDWILFCSVCLMGINELSKPSKNWLIGLFLLTVSLFAVNFILALVELPYSPDEAIWADLASSLRTSGGLYVSSSLARPFLITPGVGWIHALYGEIQWLFDWDLRVGRIFHFVFLCLGLLGIASLTALLYGRKASLITSCLIIVGNIIFRAVDYRPDHFLIIVQSFSFTTFFLGLKASSSKKQAFWHFATGIIVTLGMQFHAAAITFCLGFCIYYTLWTVWQVWQNKKLNKAMLIPIIMFGIGAAIGTAVYFGANVLPVGGLNVYLGHLLQYRGVSKREFRYFTEWTPLEGTLIAASFLYLIWRRKAEDRIYLGLFCSMVVGIFIADTQGYFMPYRGLFLPFIGVFLLEFFADGQNKQRAVWMISLVFLAFAIQGIVLGSKSVQIVLSQKEIPEASIELLDRNILSHIQADDQVIVGTHELIWVLAENPNFYSPLAEAISYKDYGWSGEEVWTRIDPDVYIEIPRRLETPVGLANYLDREGFVICESFTAYGYRVNIYRQDCSN